MANFRCTKCSHLATIPFYPGHERSDLRHSYCGGTLERIQRERIGQHRFRTDQINRPIFKSKSGHYTLDGKVFHKLPI